VKYVESVRIRQTDYINLVMKEHKISIVVVVVLMNWFSILERKLSRSRSKIPITNHVSLAHAPIASCHGRGKTETQRSKPKTSASMTVCRILRVTVDFARITQSCQI